ncbi:MAG: hypothetical protein WBN75_03325 [Verrucomicrobiia bacterium]|jgi:probable HAF family extracellular repeat protein
MAIPVKADFKLINLGTLGGLDALVGNFAAMAINDRGEIIGNGLSTNGIQHAFYYSDGAFRSLSTNPCIAAAINNAGQIVGDRLILVTNIWFSSPGGLAVSTNVGFAQQPVIFSHGLPVNLFQGVNYGDAMGINDNGEIVGSVNLNGGSAHGFAYQNGLTTDLGSGFMATGINNHGDIVGQSFTFSLVVHPLLYHDGLTQDLGTLGGTSGSATAINDLGEIIGWSATTSNAETHAFLYRNGTMTDLGTFGAQTNIPGVLSYSYSSAYAINNWGQIVGTSTTPTGIHAFLYWDGTMVDLNDLVKLTHVNGPAGFLALNFAYGINDWGQIVGTGRYWDGAQETTRAFLLDWRP